MGARKLAPLMLIVLLVASYSQAQQGADDPVVDLGIDAQALPYELTAFEGEVRGLWRDGRVFIGGQPDEEALARMRDLGVTAVVNLRTQAEMDDRERVPFDESGVVGSLEMEYVHIPLGGEENPYTPEAVDRFADVLRRHEGPVFLHCTVAWRASYMWVAYLVREQEFALGDAMRRAEAMAINDLPIEGLLGRPLELAYAD